MDRGKGPSGQKTLTLQPYPIPWSQLPSGMQVRGFKPNRRTCPNWTLDPCQVGGLLVIHGRVPRSQYASRPYKGRRPMHFRRQVPTIL